MAVAPNPMLKAHPDVAKLNSFSTPFMVTITRHLVPRGGEGMSVVPTQQMTREVLFNWQGVKLLTDFGPGYYHFHVVDPGGNGEDEWKVKLGTEAATQEGQMPGPFASPSPMGPPPGAPGLDPDVKQIMPGFFYNEALGLLSTPWRATVPWRPDQPLPIAPATTSAATPAASTWAYPGWNGGGGQGGFGWPPNSTGWGFPAADDSKIEALKAQMAEQARQLESERRQRDEDKREREAAEQRTEMRRMQEDTNKRFETLFEKLTAKPSGPSESELALRREIEETKRHAEAVEAETRRREEMRLADDRHREEMRLMREEIKANAANKPDPMLNLLTSFLTTSQVTQGENVRMIRESSAQATAAAERGATQVLELARSQRDGALEGAKLSMDMMKDNMSTQREFYGQMLEMKGSDNSPWWAGMAQEGLAKIGAVGQALAERAQQQQQTQQTQYIPPQRVPSAAPRQQTVPGVPMPTAIPSVSRPGFVDTGGRPAGTEWDQAGDSGNGEWVLQGGYRVKNSTVQLHGWKKAIEDLGRRVQRATPTMPVAAPAQEPVVDAGVNGAGNGVHAATPEVPAPSVAAPARGSKKRRGTKGRRGPQLVQPEAVAVPAATPPTYDTDGVAKHKPEDVFESLQPIDDPTLFGEIWSYVQQLRMAPPAPAQTVDYVLKARSYVRGLGKNPPAMELVDSEHYEVLVLRLFPQAPPDYRNAVVEGLRAALAGEADDDDEGEDEGEGEETQP